MGERLTVDEVAAVEDTGRLWRALVDAKERRDTPLVRAIENRMRVLGEQRRFAHLSDAELEARIRGVAGNREAEGLLAYSPASGQGLEGAADTAALNRAIRGDQHVGVERTLAALMDEWRRRQGR